MSCFQKAAFSKRTVKKGTACREGMVSQGADMKVYLEGFEKHHETGGGLASEKQCKCVYTYCSVQHSSLIELSYCTVVYSIQLLFAFLFRLSTGTETGLLSTLEKQC